MRVRAIASPTRQMIASPRYDSCSKSRRRRPSRLLETLGGCVYARDTAGKWGVAGVLFVGGAWLIRRTDAGGVGSGGGGGGGGGFRGGRGPGRGRGGGG